MPTQLFRTVAGICLTFTLCCAATAQEVSYRTLNADKAGEEVQVEKHLVDGKINVIDFTSAYCPPAKAFTSELAKLAKKKPDLVVGVIEINRPGQRGIDWDSPVAQQYRLRHLPHLRIYDEKGELVAEGQEAKDQLVKLMEEHGI